MTALELRARACNLFIVSICLVALELARRERATSWSRPIERLCICAKVYECVFARRARFYRVQLRLGKARAGPIDSAPLELASVPKGWPFKWPHSSRAAQRFNFLKREKNALACRRPSSDHALARLSRLLAPPELSLSNLASWPATRSLCCCFCAGSSQSGKVARERRQKFIGLERAQDRPELQLGPKAHENVLI